MMQSTFDRAFHAATQAASDGAPAIPTSPAFESTEHVVQQTVQWLRLLIESTGAVIIAIGLAISAYAFVRAFRRRHDARYAAEGYNGVRLTLARYLALSLEFQLGSDILSTAVAPGWQEIGKLGAIAVIRTALNYFLGKEMREEAERAELRDKTERHDAREQARTDGRGGAGSGEGRPAPHVAPHGAPVIPIVERG